MVLLLKADHERYYFYVCGIDNYINKEQLATIFKPYGTVLKSQTYEKKNFGFVDLMTTEVRAVEAIIKLSGIEYCENVLKVNNNKTLYLRYSVTLIFSDVF